MNSEASESPTPPAKKTSGPRARKQAMGFALGGAIGLVIGVVIGLVVRDLFASCGNFAQLLAVVLPSGLGFFAGSVLGAALGRARS